MTIYSLDSEPLPENYTPLEAVAIIKCLDEDGDVVLITRHTDGLPVWDRIGLLTVELDIAREHAKRAFIPDESEEDE